MMELGLGVAQVLAHEAQQLVAAGGGREVVEVLPRRTRPQPLVVVDAQQARREQELEVEDQDLLGAARRARRA